MVVEWYIFSDNGYIGNGDSGEKEGGYVIEDGRWNSNKGGGEFGEDIYDDKEEVMVGELVW